MELYHYIVLTDMCIYSVGIGDVHGAGGRLRVKATDHAPLFLTTIRNIATI